jgi:hypothetical protein
MGGNSRFSDRSRDSNNNWAMNHNDSSGDNLEEKAYKICKHGAMI